MASFEPAAIKAKTGDEFVVGISVGPGVHGVSGGEVIVSFPSAVLEVVSYEPGTLLGSNPIVGARELDPSSGSIRMALARQGATTVLTAPGNFMIVRFRVKQGAQVGTYQVSVKTFGLSDERFVALPVSLPEPAVVQIGPVLVGDANGDSAVDYRDLAMLGAAYGTRQGEPGFDARVDFNGDGIVDYRDLAMLGANYGKTS
ncbi:MAG: cohesin domain-containing protein [Chloroflexota bacterium]|nr:cohesin domain-containing protein [Chloroflexota bacterium]